MGLRGCGAVGRRNCGAVGRRHCGAQRRGERARRGEGTKGSVAPLSAPTVVPMDDSLRSVDPADVPADAQLFDVREQDEWDAGHAPTARHLPASELAARLGELPEDGDVYLVCRSGGRSRQVAMWLERNGYDAVDVRGGMDQWFEAGLPMVRDGDGDPFVL